MKDTVVILGSHPRTRGEFDFNRTDCDIWVFNESMSSQWVQRADAVFQLHIPTIWRNPQNRNDPAHYGWLKSGDTPIIYMQEQYEDVPKSVHFPKDEVLNYPNATTNGKMIREATSSVSWAIAHAIYLGYKRIEIFGVELSSNTEYTYQRENFKYWVGVAVGKGIEVDVHSDMFNNPLYGYEGEVFIPYETFSERIDELGDRQGLEDDINKALKDMHTAADGMIDKDNTDAVLDAVQSAINAAVMLGEKDGAIQENNRYKIKADEMLKAGDSFVFSRQEFEHAAATHKKESDKLHNLIEGMKGQMDIFHNSVLLPARGSPKRRKNLDGYKHKQMELIKLHNMLGILHGAMKENYKYMARLDAGIKAAGGAKSEAVING
jgi:hypothetical protein